MRKIETQRVLETCSRSQSSTDLALNHYPIVPLIFYKQMLPKRYINDAHFTHGFLQHSTSLVGEEGGAWHPRGSHGKDSFLRLKLRAVGEACGMNTDRFPLPQEQQSLVYGKLQLCPELWFLSRKQAMRVDYQELLNPKQTPRFNPS